MANYKPLTPWQIEGSTQRVWLGVAARLVADVDDSTPTSYHVYAEVSCYQFPGAGESANVYYYHRTSAGVVVWPPFERVQFTNGTGLVGNTRYEDLGVYEAGETVTSPDFRTGISLTSGWVYSSLVSVSYTIPVAPSSPTSVTNTRVSDQHNNVTWSLPSTTYTRLRLKRYADGTTLSGEWTIGTGTSYTDTSTGAGHSYTYKASLELVSPLGDAFTLSSAEVASNVTYNSPAAPTAISGARLAATSVRLTLANTATTSTGLEIEASQSATDWSAAVSATYSGAGLTTADFTGVSGTYYFRARNTRGSLVSEWSPVSAPIVTLVAPNPPTLLTPSTAVWNKAQNPCQLAFRHNPLDGSAQTAAEVQTSTNGGTTWSTHSLTTATQYALSVSSMASGTSVSWRARTKGAAADWSAWSAVKEFTVYSAPSVSITLKDSHGNVVTGGTLTDMPLTYEVAYVDASGTMASGSVTIGGYSEPLVGNAGTITSAEFLPDNGTEYTFSVNVASTTSLTATASASFTTDFVLPQAATLEVSDNGGIETLTVGLAEQQAGETAAVSMDVYRLSANGQVLIASAVQAGATITDRYAPLNVDYKYIVATISAAGIARKSEFAAHVKTGLWLVLWDGGAAAARWNPTGSVEIERPQKTQVYYAGRTYPVSYDGTNIADVRQTSWTLLSLAERDAFIALMNSGGRGVYKSGDGDVFMADFTLALKPEYTASHKYGEASLKITRIESEAL